MKRTPGSRRVVWVLAAACVAALLTWGAGPVIGEDTEVTHRREVCSGTGNDVGKRAALEDLKGFATSDARRALEDIVDGSDESSSVLALLTIGRSNHSGAANKLRAVFESGSRSHAVRVAAFQAYARTRAAAGDSWDDIAEYLDEHVSSGTRLHASCSAARAALFTSNGTAR